MEEGKELYTLSIGQSEINTILSNALYRHIKNAMEKEHQVVEDAVRRYFSRGAFLEKQGKFDSALDWAVEYAFREGLQKAMEELNFTELIAKKCKEILQEEDFIKTLAEKKIRSSLGLSNDDE